MRTNQKARKSTQQTDYTPMMSSSVFSETLQEITTTKLSELSRRRTIFEDQKTSVLTAVDAQTNQQQRLAILIDGVKQCFAVKSTKRKRGDRRGGAGRIISGSTNDPNLEVLLKNFERFLEQARYDPSISVKMLGDWESSLKKKLDIQSLRYQYADLYGKLVTEWLSAEQTLTSATTGTDALEDAKTEARDTSRAQWEGMVFETFETDTPAIAEFLGNLFGNSGVNKDASRGLAQIRGQVEAFELQLASPGQFNVQVLRWVINGLLSSGLLSEEKNAVLKDFLGSTVILNEVADVLNMRMASLDTWSWEADVPVEQRRHLTGAFHMYIDEDLLQAIFLQFLGIKWAIFFKQVFTSFYNFNEAWTSLRPKIPTIDERRREYFLGPQQKNRCVQSKRQSLYKSKFFMSQLPDSEIQHNSAAEGEEEVDIRPSNSQQAAQMMPAVQAPPGMLNHSLRNMQSSYHSAEPRRQMASKAAPRGHNFYGENPRYEYDTENDQTPMTPMARKQFLLHLVSTEIIVNTRLHNDFTCTRSEFDSFFPSLPHSTIYAVLAFFGLSEKWLEFFRKFLEAPLKFVADGISAESRVRKRGVPGAHALSMVCGEVVLFCLDYSVNQKTNGSQLYRMHDDFWVWSSSHEKVVQAWQAITEFRKVFGLSLNEAKTGTVRVKGDRSEAPISDHSLPVGDIRWGFLRLDAKSGRFLIDQNMVDKHIEDLRIQLDQKKGSVFSWIQAWNTYAGTFFRTNFGKPANCFGREHVDMILSTMTHIQTRIFSDSNVVDFLKTTLDSRFGIKNIADGYLYLPTSLGGLELQNPFIGVLQIRDAVFEQPTAVMDDYTHDELSAFTR